MGSTRIDKGGKEHEQLNLWVTRDVAELVRVAAAKERKALGEVAGELIRLGDKARRASTK